MRRPVSRSNPVEVRAGEVCEVALGVTEDGVLEGGRPTGVSSPHEEDFVERGEECVDLEDVRARGGVDVGRLVEGGG